jgi:Cu-Zn family superoxide dismutase
VNTKFRRIGLSCAAVVVAAGGVLVAVNDQPAEAASQLAVAKLQNQAGEQVGRVVFIGSGGHADRVDVKLELPADAPGLDAYHGLHVHKTGECVAPFTSAGGHWSLEPEAEHGQHTGDLPSMLVADDGTARAKFQIHRFDVDELFDDDGSAVVLHALPDNFANVPIEEGKYEDPHDWYHAPKGTAATGDAGDRYACGVVQTR